MRMDRDANYVAVGAFVLLVIAMAVSFVFWYTEQRDKRTYERYEIYFPGTVSGLSAGSPVRYLGVDVGKVVRIMIDPRAAQSRAGHRRHRFHGAHRRAHPRFLESAGHHGSLVHRFEAGPQGQRRRGSWRRASTIRSFAPRPRISTCC